jgi:uncharacterized protein YjbI with pentapeptide repeats
MNVQSDEKCLTTITLEQLKELNACKEARRIFPRELLRDGKITLVWTKECSIALAIADGKGPGVGALDWAERKNVIPKVLKGSDLRGASLSGADLGGADLRGVDLSCANLRYANLEGANLGGADLGGSNLVYADLGRANIRGANLRYANLSCANLWRADLGGADLRGANLRGAYRYDSDPKIEGWKVVDGKMVKEQCLTT